MIYTFYSYKGGVGRSMALANIAQWFYLQQKRVIMIDWDLEAPGLEGYFHKEEEQLNEIRSRPGLIDLLEDYKSVYAKQQLEISQSEQEIEGIIIKLWEELQETETDWPYMESALHKYASLNREEIHKIEQEINSLNSGGAITLAGIVEVFKKGCAI